MEPRPISRRAFLGGSLKAPKVTPAPSIGERCMAAHGVYCRSCADACAEGAMRATPALGGTVRIAIEPARCTRCGDCVRACPAGAVAFRYVGEPTAAPAVVPTTIPTVTSALAPIVDHG